MTTVNAVGQQYGYGSPTGVIGSDISITPDGQQFAWLVGVANVVVSSNINVVVNVGSQSYGYQFGQVTIALTTFVNPVGQQYNYQLGNPSVQTTSDVSISAIGQQYSYAFGSPAIQLTNGSTPSPIVIVPTPGETFTIEGCPHQDTTVFVESSCGQVMKGQTYIYNGVLLYNGLHTYGAS